MVSRFWNLITWVTSTIIVTARVQLTQPWHMVAGHGATYHDSAPVAEHGSLTLQEESQGSATGQEQQGNDACEVVIVEEPRDLE